MERIQFGETSGQEVISKAIDFLDPVLQKLRATETTIGAALDEALQKSLRKSRTIGPCPVCKSGELVVIRSRSTGKRFVGCSNYQKGQCRFSAPLPQSGTLQLTEKKCQACGFPIVIVRMRGKWPWYLCVNTKCERNTRNKPRELSKEQPANA
jgi:DNA topoisomerase-1